jgi:hypothetical protein
LRLERVTIVSEEHPVKVRVGKGRTIRPGDQEEWVKEYYELEMTVEDPSEIATARANMLGTIDAWLSEAVRAEKVKAAIPRLDLAELETLPWTTYHTKTRAKPGEAGWIKNPEFFKDIKDEPARSRAIELAKAIKAAEGKLQLGEYEFTLSGEDDRFIGRRPVSQGKAKDNPSWKRRDQALRNIKGAGRRLTER